MRLAYLSTDELNRSLVQGWAGRRGMRVACPGRADRMPGGAFDAVLLDLDHLPEESLAGLVDRLDAARGARPIAAHGYGTSGEELRARGLVVHPRLYPAILRDLASAATAVAPARAEGEGRADDLTWVDLA